MRSLRRGGSGATSLLLALLFLLSPPANARPTRHHAPAPPAKSHSKHVRKPAPTKKAKRAARTQTGTRGTVLPGDPQTLVNMGKRPGFYDPNDLSKPPVISAPSAIVIDAESGQALWTKDADARRFPASTTKILTALLFIEHSQPEDIITCTDPNITRIEPSTLNIKPWEKFTAQDLLYGFLIRSANDGAVVIAEHVAGSVPKFADMMNERARQIGAVHSHFVTPNGLHDPNHYTTARDMAMIAREAMKNPRFEDAVSQPVRVITRSINTKDSRIVSHIKTKYYDKFLGADGVKTGYTSKAGYCFVGSATRDGRRLISVVFHSKNAAINDTIPTLDWAFARFPSIPIAQKDAPGPAITLPGAPHPVATLTGGDLHATGDSLQPGGAGSAFPTQAIPANITLPVKRGDVVGKLVAKGPDGQEVGEVPLLAAEDVARPARSPFMLATMGGAAGVGLLLLVGFRYGAASAKSARRRRSSLAAARRGDDSVRPGPG